jgi:uncharacterized membrane protein
MRKLSDAAKVAKLCRKHLKARATSKNYAGGSSVTIRVRDISPREMRDIREYVSQYEMGYYDAMEDIYNYTNARGDIPQVSYVFIDNEMSEDLREFIRRYLKVRFSVRSEAEAYAVFGYGYDRVLSMLFSDRHDQWGFWPVYEKFKEGVKNG